MTLPLDHIGVDRVRLDDPGIVPDRWFTTIPAVAQLVEQGVELVSPVTVIVGENGSGKSTFVEAVARRWGDSLTAAVKHWSPHSAAEDSALNRVLVLDGERPRPQGGVFLRAEAMHTHFGAIDAGGPVHAGATRAFGGELNTRSHGESFLAFLESQLHEAGLFVLDEPEAALSFQSCLRLLALFDTVETMGSQVLLATHSPLLAAYPGATVLEFGEHGIRRAEWDELELVQHWRTFLDEPRLYLRHLFPER